MSLIRSGFWCSSASALLIVGACSGSDYQGGGRRTDLGMATGSGISLAASGDGNLGGNGGAGAGTPGHAGDAGCGASGEDAQGLAVGCVP